MQPGMITYGDKKADMLAPTRPGGTFKPFCDALIRLCGCAFRMSYAAASKDSTASSYASLKYDDNEDARAYRYAAGLHARHLCQRVLSRFAWACAMVGIVDLHDYSRDPVRYERWDVITPKRQAINPLQEAKAHECNVANGFEGVSDASASASQEPADILRENGRLKKLAQENGMLPPWAESGEALIAAANKSTGVSLPPDAFAPQDELEVAGAPQ